MTIIIIKGGCTMKPQKSRYTKEQTEILSELYDIKNRLDIAHNKLDNTTDEILIDSIIFEIKSLNKKYDYYLNLCKAYSLEVPSFTRIG